MTDKPKLTLKPINDLLGEKFFIPDYQRGYRWTERQVRELLDDIWEFRLINKNNTENTFYCLQPVVVIKNGNGSWEVVDGQQRLTTIYIILSFLESEHLRRKLEDGYLKPLFSIRYETRLDSEIFLSKINLEQKTDNVDYYHICEAYMTIKAWFKEKNYNEYNHFLDTLLAKENENPVTVIWYDLSDECINNNYKIDVFTRINIGKIPLTNAELIKALFLGKIKFKDAERIEMKRIQIANEWDNIENTLQKDDFWYFVYNGSENYDTRIEYIFDIMKGKTKNDELYFTFHEFNKDFNMKNRNDDSNEVINDIWLNIKKNFQYFQDWFNNRVTYHYIGYLITTNTKITELIERSKTSSKLEFREYLIDKIKNNLNLSVDEVDELEYGDKKLRNLLLLFNIQTLLNNQNSIDRFPFHLYKTDFWDIEHIRSIKSDAPTDKTDKTDKKNILEILLQYFVGEVTEPKEQIETIDKLENKEEKELAKIIFSQLEKKNINDGFTDAYNAIIGFFHENDDPDNVNSLDNLTLLNREINRSYKNAPFSVKRQTILKKAQNGTFIPLCTKNIFLKAYNTKFSDLMYWRLDSKNGNDDGSQYLKTIKDTLKDFLLPPRENNNIVQGDNNNE